MDLKPEHADSIYEDMTKSISTHGENRLKGFCRDHADTRKSVPEATQILLNGLMDYLLLDQIQA